MKAYELQLGLINAFTSTVGHELDQLEADAVGLGVAISAGDEPEALAAREECHKRIRFIVRRAEQVLKGDGNGNDETELEV